jgi:hypothetical protein
MIATATSMPQIHLNLPVNNTQEKALAFNLSKITERYISSYEIPREVAKLHEVECKKYLVLCALFPDESLGMKGPVDNYWHTFLLFTKEYAEFCNQIAGFFIHHVPTVNKQSIKGGNGLATTMERYRLIFGEEPDPRAWPNYLQAVSDTVDCKDDCSTGPGAGDCTPAPSCNEPEPSCDNK